MRHALPGAGRHRELVTEAGVITLRLAVPGDLDELERLAQLDSAQLPPGPILLAQVDDELRVALSLSDGMVIANPFHPAVELIGLMHEHAAELSG